MNNATFCSTGSPDQKGKAATIGLWTAALLVALQGFLASAPAVAKNGDKDKQPGHLAFSGTNGDLEDIFVSNADGSGLHQVSNSQSDGTSSSGPSISPDGSLVAYQLTYDHGPSQLKLSRTSAKRDKRATYLVPGNGYQSGVPAFSPDGKYVAFQSTLEKPGTNNWDVYIVSPAGGLSRRLTNLTSLNGFPQWQGSRIIFWSINSPIMHSVSTQGNDIQNTPFNSDSRGVRISPSGAQTAKISNGKLWLGDASGKNMKAIFDIVCADSEGCESDPAWSPTGTHLAFATTAKKSGSSDIAVVRSDGSGFYVVTDSKHQYSAPSWGR